MIQWASGARERPGYGLNRGIHTPRSPMRMLYAVRIPRHGVITAYRRNACGCGTRRWGGAVSCGTAVCGISGPGPGIGGAATGGAAIRGPAAPQLGPQQSPRLGPSQQPSPQQEPSQQEGQASQQQSLPRPRKALRIRCMSEGRSQHGSHESEREECELMHPPDRARPASRAARDKRVRTMTGSFVLASTRMGPGCVGAACGFAGCSVACCRTIMRQERGSRKSRRKN